MGCDYPGSGMHGLQFRASVNPQDAWEVGFEGGRASSYCRLTGLSLAVKWVDEQSYSCKKGCDDGYCLKVRIAVDVFSVYEIRWFRFVLEWLYTGSFLWLMERFYFLILRWTILTLSSHFLYYWLSIITQLVSQTIKELIPTETKHQIAPLPPNHLQ